MANSQRDLVLTLLESAVANVQQNEEKINDLNIFPVPDGDTGSNMTGTLIAAWNNISKASTTDVEILNDFSRGALLGARGNSGVITSQIIKGFSEGVKKVGKFSADANDLRVILSSAKNYAYKAVQNPVEGTILSVVKALEEKYERDIGSATGTWKQLLVVAREATEYTPEQLPVLKEAGVVDSGAYGLTMILEGVVEALTGNPYKLNDSAKTKASKTVPFVKADPTKNIGYCTEFILTLKEPSKFNEESFKKTLIEELNGDSLVMIVDGDILKVHVHVKEPGHVFNGAQKFGEFSFIKSENMATQAEEAGHIVEGGEFHTRTKLNDNELAIVAVSNGEGLDEEFRQAGVNYIISGGQTMNPSVEDFVAIIKNLNYKNIVLLPNNSNIILTAETAKELQSKDKNIFVVPTKTLQQGLVAVYNINKEMYDFHDYKKTIENAISSVSEGQITAAVRDTEMNGINIKKGDFISLKGKEIISSTENIMDSAKTLIDKIITDDSEVVTIIYNDDINESQVKELIEYTISKNEDIEVETLNGGQAVYHLLIFGEK